MVLTLLGDCEVSYIVAALRHLYVWIGVVRAPETTLVMIVRIGETPAVKRRLGAALPVTLV